MKYFFYSLLAVLILPWAVHAAPGEQLGDIIIKEVLIRPSPLHQGSGETVTLDLSLQNIGQGSVFVSGNALIVMKRTDQMSEVARWSVGRSLQIAPGVTTTIANLVLTGAADLEKQVARIPIEFRFDSTFVVDEQIRENNLFSTTLAVVAVARQDTRAPVLSNIIVDASDTSAVVRWQTDELASTQASWGVTDNNLDTALQLPRLQDATNHQVSLNDLKPATHYFIRIRSRDLDNNLSESPLISFTTKTLAAATPLQIILDKKVCEPSGLAAQLNFSSNLPATARLQYGLSAQYGDEVIVSAVPLTHFSVRLPIEANTTSHFRLTALAVTGQSGFSIDDVISCQAPTKSRESEAGRPVIQGVTVGDITKESAVVAWQTDRPTRGRIEYGVTSSYGELGLSEGFSKEHRLNLRHLQTGALYHFRIYVEDALTNWQVTPDQTWQTTPTVQQSTGVSTDNLALSLPPLIAGPSGLLVSAPRGARSQTLAATSDGLAVAWEDTRSAAEMIGWQWFDLQGLPVGAPVFLTSPPERTTSPELMSVGPQRFLLAWQAGGRLEVAQVTREGQILSREIITNQSGVSDYRFVSEGLSPVLYWAVSTANESIIMAARLDAQGKRVGETVTVARGTNPWLVSGPGGLAMLWQQGGNILFQYLDQSLKLRESPKFLSGVGLGSAVGTPSGFGLLWSEQNQIWFTELDSLGKAMLGQKAVGQALRLGDIAPLQYQDGIYATAWADHRVSRENFGLAHWRSGGALDILTIPLNDGATLRPRLALFGSGYFATYASLVVYAQLYGFMVTSAGTIPTAAASSPASTTNLADTLIISDVSVSCPARQLVTVKWHTNKSSDSRVEFGKEIYYGATAYGEQGVTEHEVKNIPVDPDTVYHYRIRSRTLSQPEVLGEDRLIMCSSMPTVAAIPALSFVPVVKITQPPAEVVKPVASTVKKGVPVKKPVLVQKQKAGPVPAKLPTTTGVGTPTSGNVGAAPVTSPTPSASPAPAKKSWWRVW